LLEPLLQEGQRLVAALLGGVGARQRAHWAVRGAGAGGLSRRVGLSLSLDLRSLQFWAEGDWDAHDAGSGASSGAAQDTQLLQQAGHLYPNGMVFHAQSGSTMIGESGAVAVSRVTEVRVSPVRVASQSASRRGAANELSSDGRGRSAGKRGGLDAAEASSNSSGRAKSAKGTRRGRSRSLARDRVQVSLFLDSDASGGSAATPFCVLVFEGALAATDFIAALTLVRDGFPAHGTRSW
jgi:hypothetical protein